MSRPRSPRQRRIALLIAASLATAALVPSAFAQSQATDEMGPYQFSAIINADNVYARSDSSENDYPVAKLSKGDAITVVGNNGDWLKILPPQGVFCLVGKAWVDGRGDGSVGRVRDDASSVNVRIASPLNKQYSKVVTQIKPGSDVKIIGQQDEYYQIAPPAGAFAYVHKRFVELVKRVEVVKDAGQYVVKQPTEQSATPPKPEPKTFEPVPAVPPETTKPETASATTQPNEQTAVVPTPPADAGTPATQPAVAAATESFDALEAKFNAATKLPLADQPIDELMTGYQAVIADAGTAAPIRKVAEFRLKGLGLRKEARESFAQAEAAKKAREQQQMPLVEEAKEINQRMAANEFKRYTAVGTLRTSSLPNNGKTLYRLTDPATGRTIVYVNGEASELASREGSFVGIRGVITDDANRQIKILAPQAIEAVDPAELAKGSVTSGLVPPSMAATAAEAK